MAHISFSISPSKITRLAAGIVERAGYVQPPDTELHRVWADGVYHYELRPSGYRTSYEQKLESETNQTA